jgi:hypothetical protein
MVLRAFIASYNSLWYSNDKLILLYCAVALIIFSLTGRFTEADYMIALFLIVFLPISVRDN